ncbi:MAG: serine/threonine-protein kinase [Myxococcota bacterium]
MTDAVPNKIGPYTPQQLLAMGAHAQVWLANGPGGEVALKVARMPGARASLKREASVLAEARHPHLARLVQSSNDGSWIALECVRGTTIDLWSRDRGLHHVVQAASQVLSALEHLHSLGIVHGDLKPSNVMVDHDDRVRLIDLGVASRAGESVDGFRGTLGYAAPELLSGRAPAPATDLYGLGALLYTCLTSRTPFVAPDPAALTYLPLVSLPAPPSAFRPDLPAALNQLLLALLARDPARRPSDLDRIRQTLERGSSGEPAVALVGMLEEREVLRRAVVGAADGEPRVVVVYGAPGSGRRTLIAEAAEHARREGLPYIRVTPNLRSEVMRSTTPPVVAGRASHRVSTQVAQEMLAQQKPGLLLLHADRPVPALVDAGAIQVTPAPLSLRDAQQLVDFLGGDEAQVEVWWREAMGSPAALLGRIRAYRRSRGLTPTGIPELSRDAVRILDTIREAPGQRLAVTSLAEQLNMGEHLLLDHCDVLFAEQLVQAEEDGVVLALASPRRAT